MKKKCYRCEKETEEQRIMWSFKGKIEEMDICLDCYDKEKRIITQVLLDLGILQR
jgi:hypothetical protein